MQSVQLEGPARRMSALDAGFFYAERPHAPLSIGCVAVLEAALPWADLLRHFRARAGRVRRCAQRAVPAPLGLAHPTWEDDPAFDVRNHLARWAVCAPGGEPELAEAVAQLMARPLQRDRPLWEVHLLEGLEGGRSAVLQKMHHCMIDGIAGTGVLEAFLDPDRRDSEPAAEPLPGPPEPRRSGGALAGSARRALRHSREAWKVLHDPRRLRQGLAPIGEAAGWSLRHALDASAELPWNAPVGPRRAISWTRLSLEEARRIRRVRGATLNDVVLCALAGGLRRYLDGLGIGLRGRRVTALVPVSLRTAEQRHALGNRLAALLVPLVLEVDDELERLALTVEVTRRLKQSVGALAGLQAAVELLPPALLHWAGEHLPVAAVASLVATNVRGPEEHRYLAGRRVDALVPIVPIVDGLGLGMAVLSYAGSLCLGLNADPERVVDLGKLGSGVQEAFARLGSVPAA